MPIVKLPSEKWYAREAARALECLKAWLPREGMTVAEVKARLAASGFGHSDEEWLQVTRLLIDAGEITIE